jgi:hypothetical protein
MLVWPSRWISVQFVKKVDLRVGEFGNDLVGNAGVLRAGPTGRTGLALLLRWVDGVEPKHLRVVLFVFHIVSSLYISVSQIERYVDSRRSRWT